MVLFKPDGSEVTRLPGEVDPELYLLTLSAGLQAQTPVRQLAQQALSRNPLTPEQWRLLGYYSWETDEQQVFKTSELGAKLSQLAGAAPPAMPEVKNRLALKAIAVRARAEGRSDGAQIEADRAMLESLLSNVETARAQADLLIFYAQPVVEYLANTPDARSVLAGKWDSVLEMALVGKKSSRAEQVDALDARVALWKFIDRTDKLAPQRATAVLATIQRIRRADGRSV